MTIEDLAVTGVAATAGVIKDAGDDPDATHGARLWVRLELGSEPGVRFHAGEGVGTVTRSGLPIAVGEAAINPVPRRLIAEHLDSIAADTAYEGGFDVSVGIDDGEADDVIHAFTPEGGRPEPLRVARLAARGLVEME